MKVQKDFSLLIYSVKVSNLGEYTCSVYNGQGKTDDWKITLKTYGPVQLTPDVEKYRDFIIDQPRSPSAQTLEDTVAPMITQTPYYQFTVKPTESYTPFNGNKLFFLT